jgi:predicted membrane protein
MENQKSPQKSNGHLIGGVVVLTVGLVFLLKNMNFLSPELHYYIFSWKTLLIGIGILNLTLARNNVAGIILIAIGTFFWLPDWFDLSLRAGQLFWPVVIIIVGIALLFKRPGNHHPPHNNWKRKWDKRPVDPNNPNSNPGEGNTSGEGKGFVSEQEYIDDVAIFSGSTKKINTLNFKGGRMTAIFGGSEVNLSRSRLAPGENILNVFFMFGGSEIIVPADWNVVIEATPIFGGFSDERYISKDINSQDKNQSVLVIKGLVIFGGAELKSY